MFFEYTQMKLSLTALAAAGMLLADGEPIKAQPQKDEVAKAIAERNLNDILNGNLVQSLQALTVKNDQKVRNLLGRRRRPYYRRFYRPRFNQRRQRGYQGQGHYGHHHYGHHHHHHEEEDEDCWPTTKQTPWPTPWPTMKPTLKPTMNPSMNPTEIPSMNPTESPSDGKDEEDDGQEDDDTVDQCEGIICKRIDNGVNECNPATGDCDVTCKLDYYLANDGNCVDKCDAALQDVDCSAGDKNYFDPVSKKCVKCVPGCGHCYDANNNQWICDVNNNVCRQCQDDPNNPSSECLFEYDWHSPGPWTCQHDGNCVY